MHKTTINIARLSCWLLLFFTMLVWVWRCTIFSFSIFNYLSFIVPFILFSLLLLKYRQRLAIDLSTIIWMPWLFYILLLTGINLNIERFAYHFCCLALLMTSIHISIIQAFPKKLALFLGIFSITGIIFQYFLPELHSSIIQPLFTGRDFEGYGLNGFTYQVDVSANFILLFEMMWIYLCKDKVKPSIFWIVLIISILCIFLTGKRMHAAMSIIIPLFVYFISRKSNSRNIFLFLILGCIICFGIIAFINHADDFGENVFLHRFADTVERSDGDEDITSNRAFLGAIAIKLWEENPIFGIGDSNYVAYSGAEMDAHNAYLQTLCEQGIVGFILWIIPLIYCLYISCRILKRPKLDSNLRHWMQLSLFCQLQFVLYGFTGNPTVNFDRFVLYFFSIAILSEVRYTIMSQQLATLNIRTDSQHDE